MRLQHVNIRSFALLLTAAFLTLGLGGMARAQGMMEIRRP